MRGGYSEDDCGDARLCCNGPMNRVQSEGPGRMGEQGEGGVVRREVKGAGALGTRGESDRACQKPKENGSIFRTTLPDRPHARSEEHTSELQSR